MLLSCHNFLVLWKYTIWSCLQLFLRRPLCDWLSKRNKQKIIYASTERSNSIASHLQINACESWMMIMMMKPVNFYCTRLVLLAALQPYAKYITPSSAVTFYVTRTAVAVLCDTRELWRSLAARMFIKVNLQQYTLCRLVYSAVMLRLCYYYSYHARLLSQGPNLRHHYTCFLATYYAASF